MGLHAVLLCISCKSRHERHSRSHSSRARRSGHRRGRRRVRGDLSKRRSSRDACCHRRAARATDSLKGALPGTGLEGCIQEGKNARLALVLTRPQDSSPLFFATVSSSGPAAPRLWINGERGAVHLPALIVRKSEASGEVSGLVLRMTGPAGGSGSLRTPLRASPEPSMKIPANPRKSLRFARISAR